MHFGLFAATGVILSAVTWSRGQDASVPQTCFYYRIAVATIETQERNVDQLALTIIEVYRQGEKVRVQGEHGEIWLTDGKRAVFYHRDARRGWTYSSLPDGFVLSQLGGTAFPLGLFVIEQVQFPIKAVRTEVVGSSVCTVWDTDSLWPLVRVRDGNRGRLTIWVPQNKGTIPIGFQRLRLSIEGKLVAEARLVEAKEVSCTAGMFDVGRDVALMTISNREELLKILNVQPIQSEQ